MVTGSDAMVQRQTVPKREAFKRDIQGKGFLLAKELGTVHRGVCSTAGITFFATSAQVIVEDLTDAQSSRMDGPATGTTLRTNAQTSEMEGELSRWREIPVSHRWGPLTNPRTGR